MNNAIEYLDNLLNEGSDNKKVFYRQDNIGKAKYTINFYDGEKKHKDGSKFYDMKIFHNKKDMEAFIQSLFRKGYKERR